MERNDSIDGFPPPQADPEDQASAWVCMHRNIVEGLAAKRPGDAAYRAALDATAARDMSMDMTRNNARGFLRTQGQLYVRFGDAPRESLVRLTPEDLAPAINALSDDCRRSIAAMLVWLRLDAEYEARYQHDGDGLSIESIVFFPDETDDAIEEEVEEEEDDEDDEAHDDHEDIGGVSYGGGADWWKPEDDEDDMPWKEAPNEPETHADRYDERLLRAIVDDLPDLRDRYERMLKRTLRPIDLEWSVVDDDRA